MITIAEFLEMRMDFSIYECRFRLHTDVFGEDDDYIVEMLTIDNFDQYQNAVVEAWEIAEVEGDQCIFALRIRTKDKARSYSEYMKKLERDLEAESS